MRKIIGQMGIAGMVQLRYAHLEEALSVAKELETSGVDVLVSRGGVAGRILASDEVTCPLVEIIISFQDIADAIHECRRVTGKQFPRIALVPFHGVRDDIYALAPLLNVDIKLYPAADTQSWLEDVVRQVAADGPDVLLGGASVKLAARYKIPAVLLTSGDLAIRVALEEALKLAYARRIEKERAKRFEVVVDLSREGVVTLDRDGRIQITNPAALRILRLSGQTAGRHWREILPKFELSPCLERGETISDVIFTRGNDSLMVNARPIRVGQDLAGAVVTVQESQYISDLENRIRKELFTKGLVASYTFRDILGKSPQIEECRRVALQYAATKSTVLITGETGTGKELFAQSIHNAGPCRQGPFVAVNCAALPPSLLESELFGYEEGAFTGASRKGKPGLFELAQGGTIFLDEISEMDKYGQTRLLRILQERCIMRLGGGSYVPLNVRVLVASNRNLEEMVLSGEFRSDLYYRINLLTLHLPPLCERDGDTALLVEQFSIACRQKYNKEPRFTQRAVERLAEHRWPGNVRELQNVIERLCLSSQSLLLDATDVETVLTHKRTRAVAGGMPETPLSWTSESQNEERQRIVSALSQYGGNQKVTAGALGMDRGTLSRKMRKYGIWKTIVA